jgi:hypothetical protein
MMATPVPKEFSIVVHHTTCKGVAFYRKPGDMKVSAHIRFPDGTRPAFCSRVMCGSCGKPVEDDMHLIHERTQLHE